MTSGKHAVDRKRGEITQLRVFTFLALFSICCLLPAVLPAYTVHSKAAAVMDAETGNLLYAKNPELKCPPASTTKLMTAIVSIEHLDLNAVVTISRNASRVSPHKVGFREGERVAVEELLYAALLGSANDAAVALAEAAAGSEHDFVRLMNSKAFQIGARNTRFVNSHGLPGPGQYTTAADLAKIMQYSMHYPKLKQIINTRVTEISTESGRSMSLRNTNRLLWSEEGLIGGKTGYTRLARHCFVCAAGRGEDKVVVALLGSPSRDNLWRESGFLIDKGFDALKNDEHPVIYLAKTDDVLAPVNVSKRKSKRLKNKMKQKKNNFVSVSKNPKSGGRDIIAKKKSGIKMQAKHKGKQKKYRMAKKGSFEKTKG